MIARTILPTEAQALVELFQGIRGCVHVAFEEGSQAQWLHDLLAPIVASVGGATREMSAMPTPCRTDS